VNDAVLVAKGMMGPIGVGLYELEGRNSSQVEEGNLPSAPTLLQVNIVDHTVVSVHAGTLALPRCDKTLDPMAGLARKIPIVKVSGLLKVIHHKIGISGHIGGEGRRRGGIRGCRAWIERRRGHSI